MEAKADFCVRELKSALVRLSKTSRQKYKNSNPICINQWYRIASPRNPIFQNTMSDTMNQKSPKRLISPCPLALLSRAYPAMCPAASASSNRAPMHSRSCARLIPSNCNLVDGAGNDDDCCCVSDAATEPTDDGSSGLVFWRRYRASRTQRKYTVSASCASGIPMVRSDERRGV
jgi:hypothetical protein